MREARRDSGPNPQGREAPHRGGRGCRPRGSPPHRRRLGRREGRTGSASAGPGVSCVWLQTRWPSGKPLCPPASSQWCGPRPQAAARARTSTPTLRNPPDGPAPPPPGQLYGGGRAATWEAVKRPRRRPRRRPPTELPPRALASPAPPAHTMDGLAPRVDYLESFRCPLGGLAAGKPRVLCHGAEIFVSTGSELVYVYDQEGRLLTVSARRGPGAERGGRGSGAGSPGQGEDGGLRTRAEGSGRGDLRGGPGSWGGACLKTGCWALAPLRRSHGWPDAASSAMSRLCTGSLVRCGTWSSRPSAGCCTSCAPRKASTPCRWTRRAGDGGTVGSPHGGGCLSLSWTPHCLWPWPHYLVFSNTGSVPSVTYMSCIAWVRFALSTHQPSGPAPKAGVPPTPSILILQRAPAQGESLVTAGVQREAGSCPVWPDIPFRWVSAVSRHSQST